uniref:PNPLA domain-containing protein n=1 Tax=viral metagenome TaxID=1070528 RepID=A0A6C0DIN1_9ZZZZ
MTIKHLVISGGGPSMLQYLSAIQYLSENNFLNLNNIETIYGTSAGAIVGILLCLKFEDWEILNDYFIKRPWHELFHMKINYIFDAYTKKGIYDKKIVEKVFKPLLSAKDLPININLKDFFKYSKVELHFYSFEVNNFITEDISYLTHPELELIDAVMMSCGLPIIFTPVIIDNKCYIDGGVCANYPLKYCVDSGKAEDEILGFTNQYNEEIQKQKKICQESNLLDFILYFFFKMFNNLTLTIRVPCIKNQIICNVDYLSFNYLRSTINSEELRKELFQKGIESAKHFISENNKIGNSDIV